MLIDSKGEIDMIAATLGKTKDATIKEAKHFGLEVVSARITRVYYFLS